MFTEEDPYKYVWGRAMIGWQGEGEMTTGDTCWACFETDGDGESIKEGD